MELELAYRPTGKQLAFHASTADEVLYGGAAGGGKSYAICWDALMRCLKYPQTHAYLFRRTYPELEMTLVRTMHAHCAEGTGQVCLQRARAEAEQRKRHPFLPPERRGARGC